MNVSVTFEDANSQLLDVFSVAHVDAEERVDYSLVETWKLKLEVDDSNLNFDLKTWIIFFLNTIQPNTIT